MPSPVIRDGLSFYDGLGMEAFVTSTTNWVTYIPALSQLLIWSSSLGVFLLTLVINEVSYGSERSLIKSLNMDS
jgi:hypothetical protein